MHDLRTLISLIVLTLCLSACGQTSADVNSSGHNAYRSGDYPSALELYERAVERGPDAAEPRYNAANALYRMEAYGESVSRYDESLQDAEGELRSSGFYNRGNTSFLIGRYAEAVEAYKEALRINPDDADAKHNLELALLQLPPQAQAQAQEQDEQQQEQAQNRSEQAQSDRQDEQSQANLQEEQSEVDRQQDLEQESSQETPPAQEVPMSSAGARQILESVGEEVQTLQERRGQVLVSPNPPSEYDW